MPRGRPLHRHPDATATPAIRRTTRRRRTRTTWRAASRRCATTATRSTGWRPATFDHNKTRFPLTGAHQRVDCAHCHVGGRYTGTPTDCYACHQTTYQATKNPNHVAAGFPTTCASCHTTNAWRPATFDHGKTRSPSLARTAPGLRAVPRGRPLRRHPHRLLLVSPANSGTTNPNHVAADFPPCELPHREPGGRHFSDHSKTRFPLTGAHQRVDCAQCHVEAVPGPRPTATPATRRSTRGRRTRTACRGLPTTCASCHTTNAWTRELRPRRDPVPADRPARPWPAPSATWAASTPGRSTRLLTPATARLAGTKSRRGSRPRQDRPRVVTHAPPSVPDHARAATPRTAGRRPPSTTARRASR